MTIKKATLTLVTSKIKETHEFYKQYFNGRTTFDCGWYICITLSEQANAPELCLMAPKENMEEYHGGTMLNLEIEDVDTFYKQLASKGITPTIPLEDHPWGDRGFGFQDPLGMTLYCYKEIEASPEFKQYYIEDE